MYGVYVYIVLWFVFESACEYFTNITKHCKYCVSIDHILENIIKCHENIWYLQKPQNINNFHEMLSDVE